MKPAVIVIIEDASANLDWKPVISLEEKEKYIRKLQCKLEIKRIIILHSELKNKTEKLNRFKPMTINFS